MFSSAVWRGIDGGMETSLSLIDDNDPAWVLVSLHNVIPDVFCNYFSLGMDKERSLVKKMAFRSVLVCLAVFVVATNCSRSSSRVSDLKQLSLQLCHFSRLFSKNIYITLNKYFCYISEKFQETKNSSTIKHYFFSSDDKLWWILWQNPSSVDESSCPRYKGTRWSPQGKRITLLL